MAEADWAEVKRLANDALILDPDNGDAQELLSIADHGLASQPAPPASVAPAPASPDPDAIAEPVGSEVSETAATPIEPPTPAESPTPAPAQPVAAPTSKGGGLRRMLMGLGAVVVVVAIAAGAFFAGVFDSATSDDPPELFADAIEIDPELVATLDSLIEIPSVPGAQDDREEVRVLLDLPDAFMVTYEIVGGEDEDDGDIVRYETWVYYDLLTAFEFADRMLISHLPIDDVQTFAVLPRQYDPEDFTRDLTWDIVSSMLVDPAAAVSTTLSEEEFGAFLQVYAGEQLMVGFDDDGLLVYAETFLLEFAQ